MRQLLFFHLSDIFKTSLPSKSRQLKDYAGQTVDQTPPIAVTREATVRSTVLSLSWSELLRSTACLYTGRTSDESTLLNRRRLPA